jgi:hypothetical protein
VTRKKDSSAKRLKSLDSMDPSRGKRLDGTEYEQHAQISMYSSIKGDPSSSPEEIDYAWVKEARHALRIEDMTKWCSPDGVWHDVRPDFVDMSARALRLTFEKFKLDPEDPGSWRMLAMYLSMIFFWKVPGKSGAPQKWTPKLLMQLKQEADKWPGLPNTKVAHRITNDKASPFYAKGVSSKSGVAGLRKQLTKISGSKKAATE